MVENKITKCVCILGLGSIGLPIACLLATSGYSVFGVDTDPLRIKHLQSMDFHDLEPNLKSLLETATNSGQLILSTHVESANIYIIAVPTALNSYNQPDLSYLHTAIDTLKPRLKPYDLVIIESTLPIGTTDLMARRLRQACSSIFVAYCPERVIPGKILYELIYNNRVIGGVDEESTFQAVAFYKSFIQGKILTANLKTVEAVKLIENTYRDINVAYANELSMIADHIGLNVKELIRLANQHPRIQILDPGSGVGGRCIALNSWFLTAAAPNLSELILKARKVNIKKTEWVIQKIKKVIKENNVSVVACLGLTYKPNVNDIRGSSALTIIHNLEKNVEVLRVDPYIPNTEDLYEALTRAEIIIGLVAHDEFKKIPLHCLEDKIILDFVGIFE